MYTNTHALTHVLTHVLTHALTHAPTLTHTHTHHSPPSWVWWGPRPLLGVVGTMPPPGCGGTTPLSWVWWGHVRPLHCKASVVIVDTLPAEYGYIVGSVTPCMSSLDLQVYAYANAYGGIAPQAKCVCDNFIR